MSELKSIGEVAELLGTTTRTLRYYEQLGLVASSRVSVTAQRRYGDEEIARLRQVRELQRLLGLELDEIAEHMASYDQLDALKAEYIAGVSPERRSEILVEGFAIVEGLRAQVSERQSHLAVFADELDARLERYRMALDAGPVAVDAG